MVEIKSSLEEMCKDLKSSRFDRNRKGRSSSQRSRTRGRQQSDIVIGDNYNSIGTTTGDDCPFSRPSSFDIPLSKHFDSSTAATNLKFVLYIYEVKKMKDIYGRVTMALEIVEEKRYRIWAFFLSLFYLELIILQNRL